MRRRLLIGLIIAVAAVIGGLTAYHRIAIGRLREGFRIWAAAAEASGWHVSSGSLQNGGWPWSASVDAPDFRLEAAGAGGLAWQTQRLRLVVPLFDPSHLIVQADGEQEAGLRGTEMHRLEAGSLRLEMPFQPAPGAPIATIKALGLLVPDNGMAITTLEIPITALQPDLRFRVAVSGLELPNGQAWPLGSRVAELDGAIELSGPSPAPLPFIDVARAWQAGGGQIRLNDGLVRWGPLAAKVNAVAGLDPQLQPVATGSADLTGYSQALDLMVARHVMTNDAALAAKAVLSLLAKTPPGGGAPHVQAPFSVKQQVLYLGPIPLLHLRRVDWGG